MKFQIPSTITKVTTMSDKSLRLQVDTQEITDGDEKAAIFNLHEKLGFMMFSEAEIKPDDFGGELPPINTIKPSGKSSSQRLREVIWLVWDQKTSKEIDFDTWYTTEMNKIIEHYKNKLD